MRKSYDIIKFILSECYIEIILKRIFKLIKYWSFEDKTGSLFACLLTYYWSNYYKFQWKLRKGNKISSHHTFMQRNGSKTTRNQCGLLIDRSKVYGDGRLTCEELWAIFAEEIGESWEYCCGEKEEEYYAAEYEDWKKYLFKILMTFLFVLLKNRMEILILSLLKLKEVKIAL